MTSHPRLRAPRPPKVTPRLIRRLVEQFDPDQIILFGSHARGTAGPDSDVDLLVVMPITRKQKAATELAMRAAVHDVAVPKDIIVASPEEIARNQHITGTLTYPVMREGKILYARR
jgi:predicted nucleotidyltransferase